MSCKECGVDGFVIRPDGVHDLDPCIYKDVEIYTNVTVIISECTKCGNVEISWVRQDDTEQLL